MADKVLEELLVSSEVQTARDRLEDYDAAAMVDMPDTVRMLLIAIDRAGAKTGEPQTVDARSARG